MTKKKCPFPRLVWQCESWRIIQTGTDDFIAEMASKDSMGVPIWAPSQPLPYHIRRFIFDLLNKSGLMPPDESIWS